jgi:hypothetical protein
MGINEFKGTMNLKPLCGVAGIETSQPFMVRYICQYNVFFFILDKKITETSV